MDDKIAVYDVLTSQWTVLESPIIINRISYSQNNIFIIGTNDIYTLSLEQNNFQKYHVIPPFPPEDIYNLFYINGENFFIAKRGYYWEELTE